MIISMVVREVDIQSLGVLNTYPVEPGAKIIGVGYTEQFFGLPTVFIQESGTDSHNRTEQKTVFAIPTGEVFEPGVKEEERVVHVGTLQSGTYGNREVKTAIHVFEIQRVGNLEV